MRFVDFLRTTVLLSGGAATALAAISVLASATDSGSHSVLVVVDVGWWLIAAIIGLRLGRRAHTNPPIARLLSSARASKSLPELHPSAVLVNRLWPLAVFTLLSGALAFLAPQIPGIAAGFALMGALAWRHQDAAVAAIEERDGSAFYVEQTPPVHAISLVRTPASPPPIPNASTGPWGKPGRWRSLSSSRCCSYRSAPRPGCASRTSSCARHSAPPAWRSGWLVPGLPGRSARWPSPTSPGPGPPARRREGHSPRGLHPR